MSDERRIIIIAFASLRVHYCIVHYVVIVWLCGPPPINGRGAKVPQDTTYCCESSSCMRPLLGKKKSALEPRKVQTLSLSIDPTVGTPLTGKYVGASLRTSSNR